MTRLIEASAYLDLTPDVVRYRVHGIHTDADGRIVAPQLSERIIAVGLEELRQVPDVILLADGAKRAAATSAALKTGLFNGIVTDASVAEHLLA